MRIYKSRDIDVPRDLNLTELLHSNATPMPESHLIAKDNLTNRSITLGELRDRAGRIAKGLKDGLNPPDQARWAIILPNSVEFLEITHAILWTAGVVCPINHAIKPSEMGHGLSVSRPHYVVAYGAAAPAVDEAIRVASTELSKKNISWPRPTVLTIVTEAPELTKNHIPRDFFAPTRLEIPHHTDTSTRLATIHLSSGTTGAPKGVALTHRNFVSNVLQLVAHDTPAHKLFHPASRTIAYTPWTHIANTTAPLFLGPYTGMLHHAMPQYAPELFAQLAASTQATHFQGVPSVVLHLANSDVAERHDLSAARVVVVGGAPLKPEQLRRLLARAPWRLVQGYGMTEAAGYVAYQGYEETVPAGSTGRLLPGIEARLARDGRMEDAPEGGPGELWLRGPNISPGYAFNSEADEKGYPEQGWYSTGDICTVDGRGYLSVIGRTKDLIKYQGFQVSPAELELHVNSHPLVAEGGVGALWDESMLTELPAAFVILKDLAKLGSDEERRRVLRDVQAAVDGEVSGYKKLRGGVWLIEKLPKNATGKILRKELVRLTDGLCSLEQRFKAKL